MAKIAVIGAGVSGLSFAKYTQRHSDHEVTVFEKSNHIGGIARVQMLDDSTPFHMIGGHCFNSKFDRVMNFVFSDVLPEREWNYITRRASILFRGARIPYPIEFSMRAIHALDPALARAMIVDYLNAPGGESTDLADWFCAHFGETLANEYFIPYNRKIWGREPSTMSPSWVVDKLPQPDRDQFLDGLLSTAKDNMPHSAFYYPKSGTQNTFIEALASSVDVRCGHPVSNLQQAPDGSYRIYGAAYDHVVYTGPLDIVGELVAIKDAGLTRALSNLEYNKVTTMIWESEATEDTWTYIPDPEILFHRLIHIGNFAGKGANLSISEAVGEVSREDMEAAGSALPQLKKPLAYNVSDHAYVVFQHDFERSKKLILDSFRDTGIHLLGRFGQWDYFNMDVCIHEGMKLFDHIDRLSS